MATRNRWIMYASQLMPGNMFARVTCHQSLEWCKESLEDFSRAIHAEDVSATLYAFTEDAWQAARNFQDVGCPFDYPDKIIERGPRGALRVSDC